MWPGGKRKQSFTNLIISEIFVISTHLKNGNGRLFQHVSAQEQWIQPKTGRATERQQLPAPSSASPLSSHPYTWQSPVLYFFGHKTGEANAQQPFPQWQILQRPTTLLNNNKKKACYHLPRTASQEGPSAPFLCECLKEKKRENNKTHECFYQARRFYFHWKRSFWFDFYEFNRSAEEKRTRPLFPPLLKHLQREFYGKQARHRKMQQIKSWNTKRSDLPFSPFGLIKAKRAAFYMFILFSGFLSRRAREQSINGKATLWEKWKSCFGGRWPIVLSCGVCLCPLKAKATKATWQPLLSGFLKDFPVFFSLSSPIWNTHTRGQTGWSHTHNAQPSKESAVFMKTHIRC